MGKWSFCCRHVLQACVSTLKQLHTEPAFQWSFATKKFEKQLWNLKQKLRLYIQKLRRLPFNERAFEAFPSDAVLGVAHPADRFVDKK